MTSLTRLWDADYNLLYNSDTNPRTVEEFMADRGSDEINCTVERSGVRWGGKVRKNAETGELEYRDYSEYLKYLTTWPTIGVVEQHIPPALASPH